MCGAGRCLPHRPGGRRVRLPVRHPRPVPGRKTRCPDSVDGTGWLRAGVEALELFTSCAAPSGWWEPVAAGWPLYDVCRGGRMAAKLFTGLPTTDPIRNASRVTACAGTGRRSVMPRPRVDHSRTVLLTLAAISPAKPPGKPLQRFRSGMARDLWFETVAVAQERAVPSGVYAALLAGSEGRDLLRQRRSLRRTGIRAARHRRH